MELFQKSMEEDDDEDMHFFRSLLPDIRALPRREKLMIRMEIERLIYEVCSEDNVNF